MKIIPKLQNAWSPLVVRSDNTTVLRPIIIEPRKMSDLAAERAIKAREERRTNPKYDLLKDREYTRRLMAKSKPSATELLAGAAADLIDGSMIGASFIPGIGLLTGTTYWGLKGAKDLSQGNYLEGVLETLPFTAPLASKGLLYAGKAASTGLLFLNSPLTGKWTLLGNTEYRLSPSMAFSGGAGLESRPIWQRETLPGMLIKSLLENGPLEKLLSKQGTISTKLLQAYINRNDVSGIDKELIGRVLLNHQGETHLDYNTLRREVLEMVPQFSRVPLTGYADYGGERLGFKVINTLFDDNFNIVSTDYSPQVQWNTFTFESPGITGNAKHYTGNPIGHSRTYTTREEPDILHVMESLSDWALNGGMPILSYAQNYSKEELQQLLKANNENLLRGHYNPSEYKLLKLKIADILAAIESYNQPRNTPIQLRMVDNYTTRQLQENLRYAAENGLTKMRYPTPESAAKIEGYDKSYINNPEYNLLLNKLSELSKQLKLIRSGIENYQYNKYGKFKEGDEYLDWLDTLEPIVLSDKNYQVTYDKITQLENQMQSLIPMYTLKHQTILKKYTEFPKQYEKLFGKGTVRNVTDGRGNTWFEVDVPLRYIDGTAEMIFKEGGLIPKKRILINNN